MAASTQEKVRAARSAFPTLSVTALQGRARNLFDVAARLVSQLPTVAAISALEKASHAHKLCHRLDACLGSSELQGHVEVSVASLRRAGDEVASIMLSRGTSAEAVTP